MARAVVLGLLSVVAGGAVWLLLMAPAASGRSDRASAGEPATRAAPASDLAASSEQSASADGVTHLLPDLRVMTPSDIGLVGTRADGTLRLKFTTVIYNAGDGPVEVRGTAIEGDVYEVRQYFHGADLEPSEGPTVGLLAFEHRHGHLHLGGFARYELWALDDDMAPVEVVAVNPKVGFCLMDNLLVDPGTAPEEPVYFDCEAEVQGVSVGYGDIYVADLFEQDLNVSHVAPGLYRLVNTANPDGIIQERDSANNSAHVDIELYDAAVRVLGP